MRIKFIVLAILLLGKVEIALFQSNSKSLSQTLENIKLKYENSKFSEIITDADSISGMAINHTKDSLFKSEIYYFIGNAFYERENYREAKNYFNDGISIAPNTNDGLKLKAKLLLDRSYAEEDLNQDENSYSSAKEAEHILSNVEIPDLDVMLDVYARLGTHAAYMGFYNDSEYYFSKGLSIANRNPFWSKSKSNDVASKKILFEHKLVYLYYLSKNEQKLLSHLKTIAACKQNGKFNDVENLMYAVSLNYAGDYYLTHLENLNKTQSLKKAHFYLTKAINVLDKQKYPASHIQFLFNKTKQLRYSEKYDEALQSHADMMAIIDDNDIRAPFFSALKVNIYSDMGDKQRTLSVFFNMASKIHSGKEALKPDGSNFKPSNILNHTGLLVEIADELIEKFPEDTIMAQEVSKYYTMGMEQLKNSYKQETFSNRIQDYYNRAIKGILRSKTLGYNNLNYEYILNNIENIENKLSWKSFLKNRSLTMESLPDSIFNYDVDIRNKLVNAKANNDSIQITLLNKSLELHKAQLEKKFPSILKYAYSEFNVQHLQQQLDEQTFILKYKKTDTLWYVFGITKNSINLKTINLQGNATTQITDYLNTLKDKKDNIELANTIHKTIIPFAVERFKNLIIIPDDILCQLPFETLVFNDKYLVYDHNLSYAPYLRFINFGNTTNTDKNAINLYVFSPQYSQNTSGNERNNSLKLEGANRESEAISGIFESTYFKNTNATKQSFMDNSRQANVLHLAMHANINNEIPELSYFEFYGDSINSKLYLEELYALRLKANLAVLSACNTGSAISKTNSGYLSLQRAFTLAGTPATVSSLWNVPDKATALIMTNFYKNLKLGQSKSEALRLAKKQYLASYNDTSLNTPYFWAGFIVSGDTAPIVSQYTDSNGITIVILVVLGVIILFFLFQSIKKRKGFLFFKVRGLFGQ